MEPLQVVRTDFYCKENAKAHHTDEYDIVKADPPTPVFRRGANFAMAIQFNRPFNRDTDVVRIKFEFGKYNYKPFLDVSQLDGSRKVSIIYDSNCSNFFQPYL